MILIKEEYFKFSLDVSTDVNRKYPCSNLFSCIYSIHSDGSTIIHWKYSCSNPLLTIYPISSARSQIRYLSKKNLLFRSKFQPIENNRSSARKVPIEATHRRALDPSKNGTPTRRLLGSMPHGRSNWGLRIPIEWLLGFLLSDQKRVDLNMVPEVDLFLVEWIRESFETLLDATCSLPIHLAAHARILYSKTSITEHPSFMNNLLYWTPSGPPEQFLLVSTPSLVKPSRFWMWTLFSGSDCINYPLSCEHLQKRRLPDWSLVQFVRQRKREKWNEKEREFFMWRIEWWLFSSIASC